MRVCKYYSKSTYDFLNNYNYYKHKEISTYLSNIVTNDFILKLLPFLILP